MLDQQCRFSLKQINREKISPARNAIASIVWHGTSLFHSADDASLSALRPLILNPGQTRRQAKGNKPATPQTEKPEPAATRAADKTKGFVWNPNPNKEDLI
ncbi:hypothetical protein [Methylomonas sp. HYX-M1]|uniref:hypothetical protein n=1 Tax=Methylomonas sp. HYX-M1 TaxID=3139307 RepID=UPI00345C58B0